MRCLLLLPLLSYVLAFTAPPGDSHCPRMHVQGCPRIAIRREWRGLTKPEQQQYIQAVKKIRTRQNNGDCVVDRLIKSHVAHSKKIHMAPCFLPWHRMFLVKYEDLLQEVNAEIAQPYWQSTIDSQKPHLSPIFDKDAFGGDGSEEDFCVTNGPFADYKVFEGRELRCLKRRFNCEDGTMDPFIGPEVVNANLNNAKTFAQVATFIEVSAHGPPHNNVGADLRSMASPNDPIFWLHHCWIDKLWAKWQSLHPSNMNAYGVFPGNRASGNPEEALIFFTKYKVKQTFNIKALCYEYEELGARKPILPPVKIDIPTNFAQRAAIQTNQQKLAARHFGGLRRRALEAIKEEESKNAGKAPAAVAGAPTAAKAKAANVVAATIEGAAIQSARTGKFVAPAIIIAVNPKFVVAPAPIDRNQLEKKGTVRLLKLIHAKPPLPEWNLINGIPQDVSDKQFAACNNITTKVNNIPGYVSPVAPWNNEKMLVKILSNAKEPIKVCAVINGTQIQTKITKGDDPLKQAAVLKESIKASVASDVVQKSPLQLYKELEAVIGPPTTKTPSITNPYSARHPGEMGLLKQDAPKKPADIVQVIEKKKAEGLVINTAKAGGAASKLVAEHVLPGLKDTRAEMKKVEAVIVEATKKEGLDVLKREIKDAALNKKPAEKLDAEPKDKKAEEKKEAYAGKHHEKKEDHGNKKHEKNEEYKA